MQHTCKQGEHTHFPGYNACVSCDSPCRRFVIEFDQHLAVNALGNDARPLNKETITAFLDDFGLEAEFALHSHIRGLSGGCYLFLVVVSLLYSFSTLSCVGGLAADFVLHSHIRALSDGPCSDD